MYIDVKILELYVIEMLGYCNEAWWMMRGRAEKVGTWFMVTRNTIPPHAATPAATNCHRQHARHG